MNPILNVQNGMLRRNLIYSKKNKKSRGKKKKENLLVLSLALPFHKKHKVVCRKFWIDKGLILFKLNSATNFFLVGGKEDNVQTEVFDFQRCL